MRYDDFRRSDDIEDRRDDSGGGLGGGGGGFGLPMGGGGGLGIGTIIVLGLVGYAFGIDPRILIGGAEILTGGGSQAPTYQTDRRSGTVKRGAPTDEMGSMISGILGEIDDRWSEIFQAGGQSYT
jgi:predicted metalloprotease